MIHGRIILFREVTHDLCHKAWEHIQEIEELGGMEKAIEKGIPKMKIEQAAENKLE